MFDTWHDAPTASQVNDPGVAPTAAEVAASESDSDFVPPASAYAGISRHVGSNQTLQHFVKQFFTVDVSEPGLLRFTNVHDEIMSPGTLAKNLLKPRTIYLQQFIEQQAHDDPLNSSDELAVSIATSRGQIWTALIRCFFVESLTFGDTRRYINVDVGSIGNLHGYAIWIAKLIDGESK